MAKEEKKEKVEVKEISAVYKVHLHCPKCAHDIKRPLLRTQGVQSVDVKFEKGEITVKGSIDEKKIHKQIEKLSKRKVEILPAPAKGKEIVVEKKETKQTTVHKTTIKVYMHCDKCEHDLRKKLLKHQGIHSVKTDMKAQTITIEGIIEPEKLLTYMKKRVHKHAEIIIPKHEKKEEKKEKEEVKKEEVKKEKEKEKEKEEVKKEEVKKEKEKEVKSTETTKIVEFKEEKKVEAKDADGKVPYFVHYVYAPQLFSDENPNACSIM
ncbi:Heavy metal-associated isoprenylated plant protein [Actinidia chinensis var. chinensis]|uniref:Heavy metal-associated isoprenylated plant protein n=1 Tax=Actinidia chinensis var. chinensis TaxID=1590841 RepID=A0A2R6QKY2_ACTCC|nr:Heavy metal-associated isoprenylated plant protein [Actinidia chinensis var. chinensis]